MLAIINAELVMKDHLIPDAVIFIEDGKISGFGEMRGTKIPEDCEIIDAEGAYVGPGLVDIHCHAGDGVFFTEDAAVASRHHLKHGTTTILPTPGAHSCVSRGGHSLQTKDTTQPPGGSLPPIPQHLLELWPLPSNEAPH